MENMEFVLLRAWYYCLRLSQFAEIVYVAVNRITPEINGFVFLLLFR